MYVRQFYTAAINDTYFNIKLHQFSNGKGSSDSEFWWYSIRNDEYRLHYK